MALATSIRTNPDGAFTVTGIMLAIGPPSDPSAPVEIWRAPDSAGAPNTGAAVLVATVVVPTAGLSYPDALPTDGTIWWYRVRVNGGKYDAGTYSAWANLGVAGALLPNPDQAGGLFTAPAALAPNTTLGFYDNGDKSADFAIDWNNGNNQRVRITTSTTKAITLSNPQPGTIYKLTIERAAAGGSYALPGNIGWGAQVPPVPTAVDNYSDSYALLYNSLTARYESYGYALNIPKTDAQVAVRTFEILSTDAVNTTYTLSFGFQPKAIVCVWNRSTSVADVAGQNWQRGVGFATDTANRRALAAYTPDGVTAAANLSKSRTSNVAVVILPNASGQVDVDALLPTGVRLIVDQAFSVTTEVQVFAIGGADVQAAVFEKAIGSGTGNESLTGLAFQPECLCVIGAEQTSAAAERAVDPISFNFAVVDNGGTNAHCIQTRNYVTTPGPASRGNTDYFTTSNKDIFIVKDTAEVTLQQLRFVAYTSDGFTYNRLTNDNVARILFGLALKGVKATLALGTTATSVNTIITLGGLAYPPVAVWVFTRGASTTNEAARWSLGFAERRTPLAAAGCGYDRNAQTTMQVGAGMRSNPAAVLLSPDVAADSNQAVMEMYAWSGGGVTFIMTDGDAAGNTFSALLLGV